MRESVLREKSFHFAIRIVRLYKYLCEQKDEYILSKQVMRSGTSIGAMVRESECSESLSDFTHKLSIAHKEINETLYWLELLFMTEYITEKEFESINAEAVELIKILTSSIKTAKKNNK
ncbi:four helix bundle protein [Capnocytophaga haemolytica]|jgi:TIGR02436 family protein|uniref:Four helix bundle protein n=1 Tax=Capnocytophaga haemolytica TaxID=45243 RepID=A0AAX2H1I2_9FLAO|nr:four helix bundle protein [Capnocytophaga haemolytica]AMD86029.1 four helix bundle protein [Capnocytophaga haemolytica]SFO16598.1 four helix bundle protein [Capnocytophaga haemolytica]SNV14674.1 four helix bundle protein [Capnocytophaga haemolytica]